MTSDAFLDQLRELLLRKLTAERTEELVREFASHLQLAQQAKQAEGKGQPEAEREAVYELGNPTVLAEDLIRRESGIDTKSAWRIATLPLLAFALYSFVPWLLALRFQPYNAVPGELMGYAVLVVFGVVVWRSRRWLLLPMAVAAILFPTMMTGMLMLQPLRYWSGESKQAALAGFDRQIAELKQEIRAGQAALNGNIEAVKEGRDSYRAPQLSESMNVLHLPFLPIPIPMASEPRYVWPNVSKARAMAAWKAHGEGYLAQMSKELRESTQTRNQIATGNDRVTLNDVYKNALGLMAIGVLYIIIVFGVLNGTLLWLLHRRRKRHLRVPAAMA